jgi:membrane fusion protein (multidrug efflux system)
MSETPPPAHGHEPNVTPLRGPHPEGRADAHSSDRRPHLPPREAERAGEAPTASEKTAPRGRKRFLALGAVALVTLVVVVGYLVYGRGKETTDDAQLAADVVPVAARVPGQVLRVLVEDNQPVKKGDLLLELDPSELQAREAQSEAELATARAQAAAAQAQVQVVEASSRGGLATARAGLTGSSASVGASVAQVAAARAALARAEADRRRTEADWKRAQELFAQGAMARAALDNAQAAHDGAQAALDQAQAQLGATLEAQHVAEERVGEARGKLDQSAPEPQIATARANAELAAARVQAASAMLDLARLQLSFTHIVAPADGVASRLSVHAGALVQVGQPLVELVPLQVYVIANFKETQIGSMRVGQRAVVRLDAFGDRDLEARVESLSGATGAIFSLLPPDNASGNYVKVVQRVPVKLSLVNVPPELALKPGLSADVTVYVR